MIFRRLRSQLLEIPELSTLGEMVRTAVQYETYFTALILGWQGAGKTTYALKTCAAIYEDWWLALDYLVFFPNRLLRLLKKANDRGEKIPCIIVDDAGIWLSKYVYFTKEGKRLITWMDRILNMARTLCNCIIFTTVYEFDLPKPVREKAKVICEVQRISENESRIIIKQRNLYGKIVETYIDRMRLGIPKPIREEYEERRRRALSVLLQGLEEQLRSMGYEGDIS